MHRSRRDEKYWQQQRDGLRAPHIAPVNAFVDGLACSGRGAVPYVAPVYGGVDARVLFLAESPGPKTQSDLGGSGLLSLENDDPSAQRFAELLDGAGIPVGETLPWNAYPWFINREPQAAELEDGVEPLRRLLGLLPRLRVIVLLGQSAQECWRRLGRRHPGLVSGLDAVPTYHTSNQAFIGSPEVRAERMSKLKEAFVRTAQLLREPELATIADLLRRRNEIDAAIAAIIGRPMTSGHLGEWIAAQVFNIALEDIAATPAFDGRFRSGPLMGKTVNVKWYLKREGVLDMTESDVLDFYLVLTGPKSAAVSSRSSTRPWRIDAAYLFDAANLLVSQHSRNVKVGVATSVLNSQWEAAEIFPQARNPQLPLTAAQVSMLRQFTGPPGEPGSSAVSGAVGPTAAAPFKAEPNADPGAA